MAKKSGRSVAKSKKTAERVVAAKTKKKSAAQKQITTPEVSVVRKKLPNVWQLTRRASLTLWEHRKLFIGLTLIYGLLNVVLAQGLSGGTDVSSLKHSLSQVSHGHLGFVWSSLGVFVTLIGSAGNTTNQTAGAYQIFLALIGSLSIIWALRQVLSGAQPRIRDAYYRGMYPLIPFLLVLMVVVLELIPLLIGSTVYSLVITNGIAVHAIEKVFWAVLFGLSALLSLYWLSSSLFALYIVTLPDMTPMKALRSARELVRHRRWTALRKILALPVILLIMAGIVMLPIITVLTPTAQYVFFLLTMSALVAVHAYMYTLYRELLSE